MLLSNLRIKHAWGTSVNILLLCLCVLKHSGDQSVNILIACFFSAPRYNSQGSCGTSRKGKDRSICKCATTAQFNCGGSLWSYSWSKNSFFFHASLRLFLPPGDTVHYSLVYFVICLMATFSFSLFASKNAMVIVLSTSSQVPFTGSWEKVVWPGWGGGVGTPSPFIFSPFLFSFFCLVPILSKQHFERFKNRLLHKMLCICFTVI